MDYSNNFDLGKALNIGKAAKNLWYSVKKPVPKKVVPVTDPNYIAALNISNAGGYLTLTTEQRALIPVPAYITEQAKNAGLTVNELIASPPIPATSGQMAAKLKIFLPYIIGAVVLGFIIFMVAKKHK